MNKRRREEERLKKQQNGNQNIYTIIILNEDRLNASTKRHRLTQWIKKKPNTSHIYCLQENHFRYRDTYRLKVGGWKGKFHTNGNQKKPRVVIHILDKIDKGQGRTLHNDQ